MIQWYIRFPEFAKLSEFLFHLGKTPLYLFEMHYIFQDQYYVNFHPVQPISMLKGYGPNYLRKPASIVNQDLIDSSGLEDEILL